MVRTTIKNYIALNIHVHRLQFQAGAHPTRRYAWFTLKSSAELHLKPLKLGCTVQQFQNPVYFKEGFDKVRQVNLVSFVEMAH